MVPFSIISSSSAITAFIIAVTVHEFSHAATAYLLGDPTAQQKGRLTLNPLSHIDPLGLLLLILVKFGWAKPVPFNPANFSYPRTYSVLVGLAGPASNFLLAVLCTVIMHQMTYSAYTPYLKTIPIFLKTSIWTNVMLGVFNLIPLHPLDGSHLIRSSIPTKMTRYYRYFEQVSFLILILLIMASPFSDLLNATIYSIVSWLDHTIA